MTAPGARPGPRWGAVVPSGGRGSRMGGADKPALALGGRSLLEHLLDGLPPHVPAALVGPGRTLSLGVPRPLVQCREDPPGGGPAAALAAGLTALEGLAARGADQDGGDPLDVVVVLPGDAPLAAGAVPALLSALLAAPDAEAAVAVDGAGRHQVLVAAHRAGALRARADGLGGRLAGLPAARLLPPAGSLVQVAVPGHLLDDVDSPADLRRLEGGPLGRAGRRGPA